MNFNLKKIKTGRFIISYNYCIFVTGQNGIKQYL